MARRSGYLLMFAVVTALCTGIGVATAAPPPSDTLVSVGSPPTPFSQNKQNEPTVTIDPSNPNVVVAGSNDNIDMESCAAGAPNTCPFTDGVGVSGIYFSFTSGSSWTQPTYTGWTARDCLGPAPCTPHVGPIGTLPNYYEAGLVSDGDPAVVFGPRPDGTGNFSWANGSRLYYANLTSVFDGSQTFRGAEAIAVSNTDDVAAAAAGSNSAWSSPSIISRQSSTTFSDKEQIWADGAATSPFFGNVYVCWASFRSNSRGNAFPTPLNVAVSRDGGSTWTTKQVGPATDSGARSQPDGCTVRTDSQGNVYVFGVGARNSQRYEMMYKSTDGGAHFTGPTLVTPVTDPGVFDPVEGRPVMDGIAGARTDLASAPSVDIASGRPTGSGATDEIFMAYVDGSAGLNNEREMLTWSTDGGATWATPMVVPTAPGDRPFFTAPAVSPNGSDLYLVYNAFTTPYRNNTTDPRSMVGVLLHADVAGGVPGAFAELDRSAPGDPRGSSANSLVAEFLGDYVYASASNAGVAAVWNDTSNAADCPAIDAYRASRYTSSPIAAPDVLGSCPATFGNEDIRGGFFADPTP